MQMSPALRALASAQDGLITRRQALQAGLSPAAIRHALGPRGPWQRFLPGVYVTFTGPLQERHRVRGALLYAGEEAVLTGSAACRGYGMRYVPATPGAVLLVPPYVRRAAIPVATIRRVRSMPVARVIRGIPCAPPERAAIDATHEVDGLRDARAALCEVVQCGLTTVDRLGAEYVRMDPRGLAFARQALADVRAGCRSAPECELRDLVRGSRDLDEPRWNEPLPDAPDLVPDAHYESIRLVLEVESIEWHRFGDAPEATERRRARLASLGWRVLPVSPRRIREEPGAVLSEIRSAINHQLRHAA
ncbi:hypothetical protein [Phytoactinopolyspora mesophila]|uniref:DUF559 domain-containing protein n=1 Tax=Phytoactinopolyspora mesophila TaxID=2650750 RepID=A0A7K3M0Z5_9ACTN|nr:hypothetical protein [Phytoactinopolyspora mesophila]NDL56944.1 hypothetical protein [Phytoactinopolyspora mesophila]